MTTAGRILVVDDDPLFQETYKDLLSAEGYTVEGVTNAADARARFTDPSVGLIILDQKLRGPGGPDEGVDLAAVAARLAPGAKVIIATAYATARRSSGRSCSGSTTTCARMSSSTSSCS